jgi:hypothetical protein
VQPAPEVDYRAEVYRYREPATPDGRESERAVLRCQQQARHVPAGESKTYGALVDGTLARSLRICEEIYGR